MNYSILYKDANGITARSEFLPFDADADASGHAKEGLAQNALIDVWKGDALVVRFERPVAGVRA